MGNLKEIAKLFLKVGIIGFGGSAVHIALMQEEVVKKRAWIIHFEGRLAFNVKNWATPKGFFRHIPNE